MAAQADRNDGVHSNLGGDGHTSCSFRTVSCVYVYSQDFVDPIRCNEKRLKRGLAMVCFGSADGVTELDAACEKWREDNDSRLLTPYIGVQHTLKPKLTPECRIDGGLALLTRHDQIRIQEDVPLERQIHGRPVNIGRVRHGCC